MFNVITDNFSILSPSLCLRSSRYLWDFGMLCSYYVFIQCILSCKLMLV